MAKKNGTEKRISWSIPMRMFSWGWKVKKGIMFMEIEWMIITAVMAIARRMSIWVRR